MNTYSILIAEDDPFLMKVLIRQFEDNNYTVYPADNGSKALKLYQTFQPNVILMDIDMPEKSGLQVLQAIRMQDTFIPIFIMTGQKVREQDSLASYELGATVFIRKPFSIKEIYALVNTQLKSIHKLPEVISFGKFQLDMSTFILSAPENKYQLTHRKAKILHLLIKNKDKLVTKEEIHHMVWQRYEINNQQMIKNLINNIRYTLEKENIIIETIYSSGYILRLP